MNLNTEKFSPPQVEKGILSRKKLLIALDASENLSDARFVYLNAPGGYGKTVAIAQWLKPLRNKLAWLCLDEHDNTPARFARQLLCALSTAQKSNRKLALAAEKISPSPTEHLLSSLELLLPNEKQYTLVLDDLHTVASNEVMKALSLVLKRLPLNFTVYLLSRLPPNDTLLDFVLKGRMTVLGANELTFDKEEIGRLFVLYGRKVCEAETQSLFDRTGGWPIAVRAYLTAQSTEEKTDTDFGNVKEDLLFRYLDVHVWNAWDKDTQDFLMKVSPASRLHGELCNRLAGRNDGDAILKKLCRENAFLRTSGQGDYRLHGLFREFLVNKLAEEYGQGTIDKLHRMLADMLFEEKDYSAAATFYIKCAYYPGISACCAAFRESTFNNSVEERIDFVKTYILGKLPSALIESDLPMVAQCAYIFYLDGDSKRFLHYMDILYSHREDIEAHEPSLNLILSFMESADFRKSVHGYASSLVEKLKVMAESGRSHFENGASRPGYITQNLPFMHRSTRDRSELARDWKKSSFETLTHSFGVIIGGEHRVMLDCQRTGICYEKNELNEAYRYSLDTQRNLRIEKSRAEVRFSANMVSMAVLEALGRKNEVLALRKETADWIEEGQFLFLRPNFRAYEYRTAIREGDREATREWLDIYAVPLMGSLPFYKIYQHFTTERALIASGNFSWAILFGEKLLRLARDYRRPLDIVEVSVLLSIAYWNTGDAKRALTALEDAVSTASEYGYLRLFIDEARDLGAILDTLIRNLKRRRSVAVDFALTLRVALREYGQNNLSLTPQGLIFPDLDDRQMLLLEFLAQKMNYRQIAEKMHVERSTIKSHLRKLYRILNVPDSGAAVLRAAELGLLSEALNDFENPAQSERIVGSSFEFSSFVKYDVKKLQKHHENIPPGEFTP